MKRLIPFLFLALLLSSCAPRVAIVPIPVDTPPYQIIKMASAGTKDIKGFKAFVKVTAQERGKTPQSLDGVLYFERPDRFRFTGLAFMGFTVFDLVLTSDKFYFYRPSEGWLYTGSREYFKKFMAENGIQVDPEIIGRALFLEKKEGEEFLAEKSDGGYDIYQARVAPGILLPRMKAQYDAGLNLKKKVFYDSLARPYLYVTMSGRGREVLPAGETAGTKDVQSAALPASITAKDIAHGILLTVDFDKYIVNPEGLDKDFAIEGAQFKGIREVK